MNDDTANDNGIPTSAEGSPLPDPHGEAALLLIESLIHGLAEKSLITVTEAVAIMTTAVEVSEASAAEGGYAAKTAHGLLQTIRTSLERDLPRYR